MTRHRAVRQYRFATTYQARGQTRLQKPICAIIPLVSTKRRRDLDNVLASLKSALDGLTDAEWWNDDHDIVGFHMIPEVHARLWGENKIVILACEEDDLPALHEAVKAFRTGVTSGQPNAALELLTRQHPLSRGRAAP